MSLRYLAGFITASYNPLKVPNAPTITTVTAGDTQLTVAFTAPSNVGGGAITSYIAIARTSAGVITSTATGASSPITITGLTNGTTYTVQVAAVNAFGPSAYSVGVSGTPISASLWTWGDNASGQLGQNINYLTLRSSPVQVGSLTNWATVGADYTASTPNASVFAVNLTGRLYAWGRNFYGQLGLGDTSNRSSPVQVGALTNWSTVAKGNEFSLAVKSDGTLWSCGYNSSGELGQNNTINLSSPVQVGALTNWSYVSGGGGGGGGGPSIAVKTDGTLWSWGNNTNGELGQNDTVRRSSPVQVGALTNWALVSANAYGCVAVKTDGTLWSWGGNNSGILGQNIDVSIKRSSPVQIGALTTWASVTSGGFSVVALRNDGTLWTWGAGFNGMLGLNDTANRSSPVQIGAGTTWLKTAKGYAHTLATKTDGTLWVWGQNDKGQLGLNNTANLSSPVQVGVATNWSAVFAGTKVSIATRS